MNKGSKMSIESRRRMSLAHMGNHPSKETRKRLSLAHIGKDTGGMLGRKLSTEVRKRMSLAHIGKRTKEKCHWWKGGIALANWGIRNSIKNLLKYRQWRSDIFTRDDFRCQRCFIRGRDINAHHIRSFIDIISEYKIVNVEQAIACEQLWNINNGVTLCEKCHKKIHLENKK